MHILAGRVIGLGLVPEGRSDLIVGLLLGDAADSTHARLEAYIIHFIYGLVGPLHDAEVPILVHCRDLALESVHEVRSHSGLLGVCASSRFGSLVVQSVLVDGHPRVLLLLQAVWELIVFVNVRQVGASSHWRADAVLAALFLLDR